MRRRRFLGLSGATGAAFLGGGSLGTLLGGCGDRPGGDAGPVLPVPEIDSRASAFGRWELRSGLPAFVYTADQDSLDAALWDPVLSPPTRRAWIMVGNRAIRLQPANDGTVGVFDEGDGLRWLVAPDPSGTGVSWIEEADGTIWGSEFSRRGGEAPPARAFGPTWFEVRDVLRGLTIERLMLCPEGEVPWVLVRVRLTLSAAAPAPRAVVHRERWQLRPRFLNLFEQEGHRRAVAAGALIYQVAAREGGVTAVEHYASQNAGPALGLVGSLIGPPATLVLERLGDTPGEARWATEAGDPHPLLEITTAVDLAPGEQRELWFRFGRPDEPPRIDPHEILATSLATLAGRLPRAHAARAPEASHETPWHAALLTGGLSRDRLIGGHTLDQASTYSYVTGFNGAARDPFQHALPLVYFAPDLALSVLRNTCAWATPNGDLPYSLDGAKRPTNIVFRPSDQNLWALWLAAEYAAATGDLAAFDEPLPYHPAHEAAPVALREHLRRQFRFFVDAVGRGERGHVRIQNADWNDNAIGESGVEAAVMIERGSSVLNSAMAAWVLPVFAGLAARLGESALAGEARAQADELRALVAAAWNGRWFHRAYAPGVAPVGESDCWLEVQPWAILCGAADPAQARALLHTIDQGHRAGSPLGARVRWPANPDQVAAGNWGTGTRGGSWFSISMTLVWAAARIAPELAWDEWRRMSLGAHTAAYPSIWEGTLSGPDSFDAPESRRPGRTWGVPPLVAMQAFPVGNLHSHAQPLLSYLRLLGVEPTTRGSLAVGSGGSFVSANFRLDEDGHGRLAARGDVVLATEHGEVRGTSGDVRW